MFRKIFNLFKTKPPAPPPTKQYEPAPQLRSVVDDYVPMQGRRTGKHRLNRMSFSARVWRYRKERARRDGIDRWTQDNIDGWKCRDWVMKKARGY